MAPNMQSRSLLDDDAYKLTMANAMLLRYPEAEAEMEFKNRRATDCFDGDFKRRLDERIESMADLRLSNDEYDWLREQMPYLSRGFLEFLRNYRYDPREVTTSVDGQGRLSMKVRGLWHRITFWEVPLMYNTSETFFGEWHGHDQLWSYDRQRENARDKARMLSEAGCKFADFGTRRRRSFETQDLVVNVMRDYEGFVGTSNVHLAMRYGVKPIGTMAHEWIQAHMALCGIRHANRYALDAWQQVYRGNLGIALTDTFGTDAFLQDFDMGLAKLFDGVRHDSGDPFSFVDKMVSHYKMLGIDPASKTIVFSDSLHCELCLKLCRYCAARGIKCSFGIGTHFTNDFAGKLRALNIVVKLVRLNGMPVVKLSDDITKAIGDPDMIRVTKYLLFGTPLDTAA